MCVGTNTNTITLNPNRKLSPTQPKTKILCKNKSAFEENKQARKQASVDYEKGEHEVSTRLISLRKADIPKHYRGTASESRPIAFRGIGLYRKWSIKSSGSVLMTTLRAYYMLGIIGQIKHMVFFFLRCKSGEN
ncbi:pentatricopeptide repeat-containing protein [Quercus suber]|uniref:Pentatricopeptide repeat-containing protein n=1 Tax=Quercus suber TaxID=58331 RepID=A0AAW0IM22_QUESU